MLKLLTVFVLTAVFATGATYGQTINHKQTLSASSGQNHLDLRRAIARETEKHDNESAVIDAKRFEKTQRQMPQKNWNAKTVVITTVIVAALVGLAIVLAYNTKRCVRRDPPGCNFADDINCQCTEYAQ